MARPLKLSGAPGGPASGPAHPGAGRLDCRPDRRCGRPTAPFAAPCSRPPALRRRASGATSTLGSRCMPTTTSTTSGSPTSRLVDQVAAFPVGAAAYSRAKRRPGSRKSVLTEHRSRRRSRGRRHRAAVPRSGRPARRPRVSGASAAPGEVALGVAVFDGLQLEFAGTEHGQLEGALPIRTGESRAARSTRRPTLLPPAPGRATRPPAPRAAAGLRAPPERLGPDFCRRHGPRRRHYSLGVAAGGVRKASCSWPGRSST